MNNTSSSHFTDLTESPGFKQSGLHRSQGTVDASNRVPTGRRALILGGGGSTGNAWLIGIVAGLFDAGLDVTTADLTVGTSAGSTAAAQLAGATPAQLFDDILATAPQAATGVNGSASGSAVPRVDRHSGSRVVSDHMERTRTVIEDSTDMADMRRRLGNAAMEMAAAMEGCSARWRATVTARLPRQEWPERPVLLTAVDAATGEPVVFDRHSGVALVDAVAASCASGFAYTISNNHYVDGGYRTNAENADLAAGYSRVLVLSPFGGRTRTPAEWGMELSAQVDELRRSGSQVETVFPDSTAEHMFGANAMDLSLRPAAAQAGFHQGRELVGPLSRFWS
ncbi:patatin-like phospholipase family protein [Paenarthrobacter aurescens]|uniref:Patatin n=1 Tax=Paenarthrobacter aurescens TaxID=43663 RepID=A0A4Y3NNB2_PAEAU|nr:patatin-like phospholipase family protein [Paenarthrobacter aurescens]MDO6145171.1 patatin-like phospholipase family protein [Paenarthrobacter aurescens]MDO6149016.1 patatin-like phospholipase family protein [Paenarthrobacter aurescens]MDO6160262.1 patatin-like phospholipase family protein [Paenarthrobacter aurescens]MDO6164121.1 patatin-like phospholipase family protein [Paenarthrobacter aurescens]GEB20249.1 patatin [Paenarthrobacter aurescens]